MAKLVDIASIASYFQTLDDPRHLRNRRHLMVDIAVIAVCGVVCGCDGPTAIHRWAKHRGPWLARHLALPNGIPSRDYIRRLLVARKPEAFQLCFRAWITSRTRERTPGMNLSWLRRFAVTLLKRHPDKDSLRGKMMSCMLGTDFLAEVLSFQRGSRSRLVGACAPGLGRLHQMA